MINRSLGLRQTLRTGAQLGAAVLLTLATLPWAPRWSCGGPFCPSCPAAQTCVWFQRRILDPRWAPALPLGKRLFLVCVFSPCVFLFRHDGCLPVCPRGDRFCYFPTGSLKLLLLRREGSSKAEDEHTPLSRPLPTSHPEVPLSLHCP